MNQKTVLIFPGAHINVDLNMVNLNMDLFYLFFRQKG